jgi:hypothetical protein
LIVVLVITVIKLVQQILTAKQGVGAPLQENQTCEVLETSQVSPQTDIPDLEAEIDRLVYALFGLTDEEIAVVEGRS